MIDAPTGQEQIDAVARKFPDLKCLFVGPWLIIWHGHLVGFDQPYEVRIVWLRWSPWDQFEVEPHDPRVFVLSPPLRERDGRERIDHLYRRAPVHGEAFAPDLCLFDHRHGEWDDRQLIANTIIPWICDWLCAYELWHATGVWHAPNNHPDLTKQPLQQRNPSAIAPSAALARLARQVTGTAGSGAVLAAASEGKFFWFAPDAWRKARRGRVLVLRAQTAPVARLAA